MYNPETRFHCGDFSSLAIVEMEPEHLLKLRALLAPQASLEFFCFDLSEGLLDLFFWYGCLSLNCSGWSSIGNFQNLVWIDVAGIFACFPFSSTRVPRRKRRPRPRGNAKLRRSRVPIGPRDIAPWRRWNDFLIEFQRVQGFSVFFGLKLMVLWSERDLSWKLWWFLKMMSRVGPWEWVRCGGCKSSAHTAGLTGDPLEKTNARGLEEDRLRSTFPHPGGGQSTFSPTNLGLDACYIYIET